MSKDPGFIFYPGDYLRDTQVLSEHSQVAYDRIMCEHMRNICISKKQLNFLTKKLTEDDKTELMAVLAEVKGGFQIPWVAESINKRRAYSQSRRKNRGGKKEKDMNDISETYDSHMDNENEIPISSLKIRVEENIKELRADKIFHENACRAAEVSEPFMLMKLTEFINLKKVGDELQKPLAKIKGHFINWLKIDLVKNPAPEKKLFTQTMHL